MATKRVSSEELVKQLETLKAQGLLFSECLGVFGVNRDTDPYAKAAHEKYHRDGAIEIDTTTVLSDSDGGNYVLAWVWIAENEVPAPAH